MYVALLLESVVVLDVLFILKDLTCSTPCLRLLGLSSVQCLPIDSISVIVCPVTRLINFNNLCNPGLVSTFGAKN